MDCAHSIRIALEYDRPSVLFCVREKQSNILQDACVQLSCKTFFASDVFICCNLRFAFRTLRVSSLFRCAVEIRNGLCSGGTSMRLYCPFLRTEGPLIVNCA